MDPIYENDSSGEPANIPSTTQCDSLGHASPVTQDCLKYTKEDLLSFRPAPESKTTLTTKDETDTISQDPATVKDPIPLDGHDQKENGVKADIPDNQVPEKKKKRSSGKNKKQAATGFEEFYADPPITPDEYQLEVHDIYHHSRSFVERIEQCIQRYRSRRKFNEVRSKIFTKYLTHGGIDSGLKAFSGGLDEETLETSTAAEIATFKATDYIQSGGKSIKHYNIEDPNWVVDFEAVAKGFFSQKVPETFKIDSVKEIGEYTGVVRNFLNYVLSHSVCPEYTREIMAARKICDHAEVELKLISELSNLMPGDFNTAASTLYGGRYYRVASEDYSWMDNDLDLDTQRKRRLYGMSLAEADRIFKIAIAFLGTLEHYQHAMGPGVEEVNSEYRSMEVVDIVLPSTDMKKKYNSVKDLNGQAGNFQPLGVLKVKHWDNPDAVEEDVSDDGLSATGSSSDSVIEEFWLEGNILEKCFIGMKFGATVQELSMGIKYFDSVNNIYCSFFTVLPSALLEGWKPPVPSERPPPTVGGGDAQLEDEKEDDLY